MMSLSPGDVLASDKRKQYVWHCIGLFALALGVRLWGIASQSLWLDEVLEFNTCRLPFLEMLQHICAIDNHPPLYRVFIHCVMEAGGRSEFWLRLPSALCGSISVVLVYIIARQLGQERAAPIAGLLLVLSPLHVWYSQETRLYSLMVMLVLVQTTLLLRAIRQPSLVTWALHTLAATAGLYTYLYIVLSWLGHGLWLLLDPQRRRETLRPWMFSMTVAVLLFVPWLVPFLQREQYVAGLEKSVHPLLSLGYTFFTFFAGYNIGPSVAELHVERGLHAFLPHLPYLAVYGLLILANILVILIHWRNQRQVISFAAYMVLCPVLGALAIAELVPSITYNVRYPIAALPFLYLGLAVGLMTLRPKLRTLLLAAIMVLSGLSLWRGQVLPQYFREDNRAAAAYVAQFGQAGEGVILQSQVTFKHYFSRADMVLYDIDHSHSDEQLASMAQGWIKLHPSLWLVECRSWTVDPKGVVRRTLQQSMQAQTQMEFPGVRVTQFQHLR